MGRAGGVDQEDSIAFGEGRSVRRDGNERFGFLGGGGRQETGGEVFDRRVQLRMRPRGGDGGGQMGRTGVRFEKGNGGFIGKS